MEDIMTKEKVSNISSKKLDYINYFRGIAILIIVAGHSLVCGAGKSREYASYLFDGGTYYFIFIAGFLFYYLRHKFEYCSYLKKKLINVISPYFFTLLPGAIAFIFFSSNENNVFYSYGLVFRIKLAFIWPFIINPPVWFIGMIFFFFLLAPFFLKITKYKQYYLFLLLITFALGIYYPRDWPIIDLNKMKQSQILRTYFYWYFVMILHFSFFYMIAMFICEYLTQKTDVKENVKIITKASLGAWVCIAIICLFIKAPLCPWNTFLYVSRCLSIIWILGFLFIYEEKIKKCKFLDKALNVLAEYSFGIFFIHFIIKDLFQKHLLFFSSKVSDRFPCSFSTINGSYNAIITFLIMLLGSIIILWLAKKLLLFIKVKNTRMFVGV